MKIRLTLCLTVLMAAAFELTGTFQLAGAMADEQPKVEDGFSSIFDGASLAGWTQKNGTATYRVEEGAIIGKTAKGSPNSFLCSDKQYGDFELRFDVKLYDNPLNSGVQIRSQTAPSNDPNTVGRVNGPQVEIEASGANGAESGYVYGEACGGWMTPDASRKPHKHFKDGEWNSYRVVAKGARIQTWINDQPVGDLTDEGKLKSHPKGFIGLQVHGVGNAGPFQVSWRNIRIKELSEDAAATEASGIDALAGKESPLKKGEVIAFFGDSITQAGAGNGGYCKLIADAIARQRPELEVRPIYAGISGHKVPDLQGRLDRDVISKQPTVVFIYIGINDVWHGANGTPKDRFDAGLRDLVKKISDAGATIVLATPSVIGEKTDGSNPHDALLEEYAEISRKVAQDTGTTLCDLRVAFIERLKEINPDNKERGLLTGDGVHLSAAGNQFVAEQTAQSIAAALKARK